MSVFTFSLFIATLSAIVLIIVFIFISPTPAQPEPPYNNMDIPEDIRVVRGTVIRIIAEQVRIADKFCVRYTLRLESGEELEVVTDLDESSKESLKDIRSMSLNQSSAVWQLQNDIRYSVVFAEIHEYEQE